MLQCGIMNMLEKNERLERLSKEIEDMKESQIEILKLRSIITKKKKKKKSVCEPDSRMERTEGKNEQILKNRN